MGPRVLVVGSSLKVVEDILIDLAINLVVRDELIKLISVCMKQIYFYLIKKCMLKKD